MVATGTGDIDFSSIWSWTIPLWGLALLVFFLGGVITGTPLVTMTPTQSGGSRLQKFGRQR